MNELDFPFKNFAMIAEIREGFLEEGETMGGKMKAFRFHLGHCPLLFSAAHCMFSSQ